MLLMLHAALARARAAMRATACACAAPERAIGRTCVSQLYATAGSLGRTRPVPIRWTSQLGQSNAAAAASSRAASSASSAHASSTPLAVGDEVEVECTALAFGGRGVCRLADGFVVLCERATPGETVVAKVTSVKKGGRFAEATKLKATVPSPHAVSPPCPHFDTCGGCTLQDVSYPAQLDMKRQQVLDVLKRTAKVTENDVVDTKKEDASSSQTSLLETLILPTLPAPHTFRYRNKMEFAFGPGATKNSPPRVGLRPKGNHVGIVEVTEVREKGDTDDSLGGCLLQHPAANEVLSVIQAHLRNTPHVSVNLPAFDRRTGKGVLRSVTVRVAAVGNVDAMDNQSGNKSVNPSEVPVRAAVNVAACVVTETAKKALRQLADDIANVPDVVSVTHTSVAPEPELRLAEGRRQGWVRGGRKENQKSKKSPQPDDEEDGVGGTVTVLHGPSTLPMRLKNVTFHVSAPSFFQTNTTQAEQLVEVVEKACGFDEDDSENSENKRNTKVVLDLFCGVGTLGLCLAHRAHSVVGWEVVPDAVRDARRNAQANGITNATFFQGDLTKLKELSLSGKEKSGNKYKNSPSALFNGTSTPDVILVDPARAGMTHELITTLRRIGPERIVYTSCNPATQARDFFRFFEEKSSENENESSGDNHASPQHRYKLQSVEPVDMFPNTPHVETVAVLVRVEY